MQYAGGIVGDNVRCYSSFDRLDLLIPDMYPDANEQPGTGHCAEAGPSTSCQTGPYAESGLPTTGQTLEHRASVCGTRDCDRNGGKTDKKDSNQDSTQVTDPEGKRNIDDNATWTKYFDLLATDQTGEHLGSVCETPDSWKVHYQMCQTMTTRLPDKTLNRHWTASMSQPEPIYSITRCSRQCLRPLPSSCPPTGDQTTTSTRGNPTKKSKNRCALDAAAIAAAAASTTTIVHGPGRHKRPPILPSTRTSLPGRWPRDPRLTN